MHKQLAWTGPAVTFPAYFNATFKGDEVVITVRAPATECPTTHTVMGQTVSIRMPRAEWDRIVAG